MNSCLRQRVAALSVFAAVSLGCARESSSAGEASDESECSRAIARVEQLREESLERDPVLVQFPDLAREHARQTRDVFVQPLAARCDDHAFVQCLKSAQSFDEANVCQ
jgi:hypothetical protein